MLIIGLTGGIASGKTTVTNLIKERGFTVLDADQFARDVVMPFTPGWQEIREAFGKDYFCSDWSLDRSRLAETIFADAAARERLNHIIHPKVIALMERGIQAAKAKGESLVFVDVPLLFEIGLDRRMDAVIVVYAEPDIQLARLQNRDGLTVEEAQSRLNAQLPLAMKIQQADYVVDNSGSLEDTSIQVDEVLDKLSGRAVANKSQREDRVGEEIRLTRAGVDSESRLKKRIALIAHDQKKPAMIDLAKQFESILSHFELVATGTTGRILQEELGLDIRCLQSGPYGGDQQIGALVAQDQIDMVIFLRDPLTAQPHEPDITALLRVCDVHNVPLATNEATAATLLWAFNQFGETEGS
ncbi:MAG: dephospho-CoA kinase [Firmicutes bacterium]|nr:dephospho-CoA kinase [Bacillota bacterium]